MTVTAVIPNTFYGSTGNRPASELDDNFEYLNTRVTYNAPTVFDYMTEAMVADVQARTFLVDVSSALSAAFNAGVGVLPDGGYKCDSNIAIAAADRLNIRGNSSASVELRFAASVDGITLTYSDVTKPPSVRGVTISTLTTLGASQTGLSITMTPTVSTTYQAGPRIIDVVVKGATTTSHGWNKCIYLEGLWYPVLEGITLKGYSAAGAGLNSYETLYGLHMKKVMVPSISNIYIQHCNDAIYEDGATLPLEGLQIRNFEMVGVRTGINIGNGIVTPQPGTFIGNGHINASYRGIILNYRNQTAVTGINFYRTTATTEAWAALALINSDDNTISHFFMGNTSANVASNNGILLQGTSKRNVISHLTSNDWNAAGNMVVSLGTADNNVVLTETLNPGSNGTQWNKVGFINSPTATYFKCLGQGTTTAAANNLDLSLLEGTRYQISGNTQINLLHFGNWRAGQVCSLHFQGTPTVKHNQAASGNYKPIMLAGAADFVATANDQLFLEYDTVDSKWYEVGRSVI